MKTCTALAVMLMLASGLGTLPAAAQEAGSPAQEILEHTGIQGGIIAVVGCKSADLPLALHAGEHLVVQALVADAASLDAIRQSIAKAGYSGAVSAQRLSGATLPYVDNLINLVVVEPGVRIPDQELTRVLVPEGVVCRRAGDAWSFRTKPRPDTIDDWSHYLHDAGNNAVAEDSVVGPPRSLQWGAPPLWLRSHETPSGIQSPVSAGGRLFYYLDEGPIGIVDERIPDQWSLVCRDAFNGMLLWKRPLQAWGWRQWSRERYEGKDWLTMRGRRTDVPTENQHRIVAQGDRVYTTLSYMAPLTILDAADGTVLATVEAANPTREILVSDSIALAYCQPHSPDAARRRGQQPSESPKLVAVDARLADILWQQPCGTIPSSMLTIDQGRIIYCAAKKLVALDLKSGDELWTETLQRGNPRTLVSVEGVTIAYGGNFLAAYDGAVGKQLWSKSVKPISGAESADLFVIDSVVWRGMETVDEQGVVARKTPNVLATGWDLRTGQEKQQRLVRNLRSPEHHHRCYQNKATSRYIISSMEGAEFLDLTGDSHSQDNWLRGSCRSGMMPCNGLLYVPPDQCFCEPGAKLLGFAAVSADRTTPAERVPVERRLERGPAYDTVTETSPTVPTDWPTLRHDPARSGSTTASVPAAVVPHWQTKLASRATPPVLAYGALFVAEKDAHRIVAFDAANGDRLWEFTAGARIDSPPTIYQGRVLFGSADGYVYCLHASDGALAWRFLAAPRRQQIAYFDQLESTWPVHGSVLVEDGVAYCTAGRSTYLDGGIHLFGLDPATGKVRYQTVLKGPFPEGQENRDVSFYVLGANSDVLVSEGGFLYMRQKKLTPQLEEVKVEVLSSKGAQDVGLHLFSTSGLLDGSWYNRTFWMYSRRWPGFQLANQAPKTGQLLVRDEERTYALRVFYHRNVHSPMFFPGQEGYLLFADLNTTEPQIVGEPGSRKPLRWLPQSDYSRARGDEVRELESEAFGLDKMIGYTRADPPAWTHWLPVRVRGMVKAGPTLFVAGAPDVFDPADPTATLEGRCTGRLVALTAEEGKVQSESELPAPPVFDGLIAAGDCLYASLTDGTIICLGKQEHPQ